MPDLIDEYLLLMFYRCGDVKYASDITAKRREVMSEIACLIVRLESPNLCQSWM